jgi:hypothetical protein
MKKHRLVEEFARTAGESIRAAITARARDWLKG